MYSGAKTGLAIALIWSIGTTTASQHEAAATLSGRLINTTTAPPQPVRGPVDLRVSWYVDPQSQQALQHQDYTAVALEGGVFKVSVALPDRHLDGYAASDLYVEVGLRAAGRKYAPFRTIPPRQAIVGPLAAHTYLTLSQPLPWNSPEATPVSTYVQLAHSQEGDP